MQNRSSSQKFKETKTDKSIPCVYYFSLRRVHFIVCLSTAAVMVTVTYTPSGIQSPLLPWGPAYLDAQKSEKCSKFPADGGFLCGTAAVFRDMTKWIFCWLRLTEWVLRSVPIQNWLKVDSQIACRAHAVPLPCRALIHTCHAAPLPCSNSAVSFVKVCVVAGNIRTASPTV
jgi:hypothetical protein